MSEPQSATASAPVAAAAAARPGAAALRLSQPPRRDPAAVLLALEAEVRGQGSRIELIYHLLNATQRLLGFSQAVLFDTDRRQPRALALSGVATVDRNQPVIRALERLAASCRADEDAAGPGAQPGIQAGIRLLGAEELLVQAPEAVADLASAQGLWLPLREPGQPARGYLLLLASLPWSEARQRLAQRLAATYAHAWRALEPRPPRAGRWLAARRTRFVLLAILLAACALPVSVSSLAPVEVAAADPVVVAAPFVGVVAEMLVVPNVAVTAGQPLLRFEDTRLRNELALGERRLQVANARLAGTTRAAIDNAEASREVAIQRAERDLAQAQYEYARDLLELSVVRSPVAGIALYSDPRDWQGRPVETGQQILRVADPARIEFAIQLPVQDSVMARAGADVRVFLDSDPLRPIAARLVRASYHAERTELGSFAYRLTAAEHDAAVPAPAPAPAPALRIGMRGTAQVYGERVPLIFALLRRPISALRQATGW